MLPCFNFLFENTENAIAYVVCASARWFITIKTIIWVHVQKFFSKGVIRWYSFHSYAMFWFLTSLVILDVACFVLACYSTLGKPFAHVRKTWHSPSDIYVENVHFYWFKQYWCTGEHFQSGLDIFWFDFMFMKWHDIPPLLCFNVQTDMRLFYYNSSFLQRLPSGCRSCCNKNLTLLSS